MNAAVMVLVPAVKAEVLNAACPELSTGTLLASTVLPSLKVTEPDGTPPLEVTVAVKVTDCPKTDGLGDDASVVVVAKLVPTVCTVLPLLAAKIKSEA